MVFTLLLTRLISNVNEKCAHCSFAASITYSVFGLRWLIIPACLSTFIAHQIILSKYVLPLHHEAQTPMLLKLLLWWRNLSLFLLPEVPIGRGLRADQVIAFRFASPCVR